MHQTAVIVEVPEVEQLVARWRHRYDPVAARGVPAHVTVLFPFVEPDHFDDEVLAGLREVATSIEPFEFELVDVDEFPGVIWLRPEPAVPFRHLTRLVWEAFPSHPPYEGRHRDSRPHLTVAMAGDGDQPALSSGIRADLAGRLPVRSAARALSIVMNRGDVRWEREHVVELGSRATTS